MRKRNLIRSAIMAIVAFASVMTMAGQASATGTTNCSGACESQFYINGAIKGVAGVVNVPFSASQLAYGLPPKANYAGKSLYEEVVLWCGTGCASGDGEIRMGYTANANYYGGNQSCFYGCWFWDDSGNGYGHTTHILKANGSGQAAEYHQMRSNYDGTYWQVYMDGVNVGTSSGRVTGSWAQRGYGVHRIYNGFYQNDGFTGATINGLYWADLSSVWNASWPGAYFGLNMVTTPGDYLTSQTPTYSGSNVVSLITNW